MGSFYKSALQGVTKAMLKRLCLRCWRILKRQTTVSGRRWFLRWTLNSVNIIFCIIANMLTLASRLPSLLKSMPLTTSGMFDLHVFKTCEKITSLRQVRRRHSQLDQTCRRLRQWGGVVLMQPDLWSLIWIHNRSGIESSKLWSTETTCR